MGLAVCFHVPPRQLGMGRICSSGFAGSKVSPVFQGSVDQFLHDPLTADWGCGLCGDLSYHLCDPPGERCSQYCMVKSVFQACRIWSALLHLKIFLMCIFLMATVYLNRKYWQVSEKEGPQVTLPSPFGSLWRRKPLFQGEGLRRNWKSVKTSVSPRQHQRRHFEHVFAPFLGKAALEWIL